MDKESILSAIKLLRQNAAKRNFKQSIDLIINLKELDFKNPEQHVDFFMTLHNDRPKGLKVCAFVGPELFESAKEACDTVILLDEFSKYDNKKVAKKLADEHDFFIAQANIMAKIASTFGKVLGTRGKMPNPKAGCVVPPKTNLKPLVEKLRKTIRVSAKKEPIIHLLAGKEEMSDEVIADNIHAIIEQLIHHLPAEKNNIRSVMIKYTMGKPVQIKF